MLAGTRLLLGLGLGLGLLLGLGLGLGLAVGLGLGVGLKPKLLLPSSGLETAGDEEAGLPGPGPAPGLVVPQPQRLSTCCASTKADRPASTPSPALYGSEGEAEGRARVQAGRQAGTEYARLDGVRRRMGPPAGCPPPQPSRSVAIQVGNPRVAVRGNPSRRPAAPQPRAAPRLKYSQLRCVPTPPWALPLMQSTHHMQETVLVQSEVPCAGSALQQEFAFKARPEVSTIVAQLPMRLLRMLSCWAVVSAEHVCSALLGHWLHAGCCARRRPRVKAPAAATAGGSVMQAASASAMARQSWSVALICMAPAGWTISE